MSLLRTLLIVLFVQYFSFRPGNTFFLLVWFGIVTTHALSGLGAIL